ncbi:MAG: response regulator [Pseudobacteriovorax sp.]|nr:response regulator [Pseudobacteriovorax sp.]
MGENTMGNILIVDDCEEIVDLMHDMIVEHSTLKPFKAYSAKEGLGVIHQNEIDVILLDLVMPEMNGIEMFRVLKTDGSLVPVIFLTGQGDKLLQNQALEMGAFDFLHKPAKAKDLFLLIDAAYKVSTKIKTIANKKAAN